jgi:hypothetical protein
MFLSESYKARLQELSGIFVPDILAIIEEAANLYKNSNKRVKFDMNLMKQAIEGGMEIGLIFQSNNEKYKMPIWKTRVVQPVAMGYDKKGNLVVRGIHVEGQSEKKAIETGVRSAQANDEWRLFKVSNIKSMFFTGRLFTKVSLPGYNPNDSAMSEVIISFNPDIAKQYQDTLNVNKKATTQPAPKKEPVKKPEVPAKPVPEKTPVKPEVPNKLAPKTQPKKQSNPEDVKKLHQKIDKLNKLL